jgi:6-pyruvoyltetrahydropterin/6-carboxytetrahydropterin synthase
MAKIRLTKEFKFEMAHALLGYNGPCKNIHGHSYYLYVTIVGEILYDDASPVNGMVMDFGELKNIVTKEIVDQVDHSLAIYDKTPKPIIDPLKTTYKLFLTPYQPTCENLIADFAKRIQKKLPSHISLFSLKLCETVTSYAEWFASDNN